jgi:hypothetical protein
MSDALSLLMLFVAGTVVGATRHVRGSGARWAHGSSSVPLTHQPSGAPARRGRRKNTPDAGRQPTKWRTSKTRCHAALSPKAEPQPKPGLDIARAVKRRAHNINQAWILELQKDL